MYSYIQKRTWEATGPLVLLQSLERVLLETCKPKESDGEKPMQVYWGQVMPVCCCTVKANRIMGCIHGNIDRPTQLCPALVPRIQQRCRESGEGLKEWWEPALWGKTGGVWPFLHGEEKAHIFPVLEGGRLSQHMEPHGEDRGNCYKVHWGRFHLNTRKKYFPGACSGVPPHYWKLSRSNWTGCWIISSRLLSHKKLDQVIFQGFFQPGLVYDSVILYWKFNCAYELRWKVRVCTLSHLYLSLGTL